MFRTTALIYIFITISMRCWCASGFDAPLPEAEREKLDQFASHGLAKADKFYTDQKYQQAAIEYETFIQGYAKSPAIPYAMFQEARCFQLDGKPREAIPLYNNLIDLFPTLIPYVVPALSFLAESHVQNRDIPNAVKIWQEMVSDADYRAHPLAAAALNQLAANLMSQENQEGEAIKLYRQGAIDYRFINPDQALKSMNAVVDYYIATVPNEPELRKFFSEVGGFARVVTTIAPSEDVAQNRLYWQQVWEKVAGKANAFTVPETDLKRKLLAYWAAAFKGRFPDWKEYQDQLAAFTAGSVEAP